MTLLEAILEIPSWFIRTQPFEIVHPIYYVGTRGLAAFLIRTPAGDILLNGALPVLAPWIAGSIEALGSDPKNIRLILLSHAHKDHAGTIEPLKQLSGAKVVIMKEERDHPPVGYAAQKVQADRVIRNGEPIELGGVVLVALLTPGHTQGTTTWTTTVVEDGVPYSVVFPDGLGINPDYRLAPGKETYPGIAANYLGSLETLEKLNPDIWLPPHARLFDYEKRRELAKSARAKAWVDKQGYREFLARCRLEIEREIARG